MPETRPPSPRRLLLWSGAYLALAVVLVATAWPRLDEFPPVTSDEAWIMSASVKLAEEGVLGSEMFAGMSGAERHYFMNLPGHHVLQAAVFRLSGAGIAQARGLSLAMGVIVLFTVGWLAFKWAGLGCSLATALLLLFWRSNLIAADPRPPLLALAQSGRYDITVIALWWATVLVLDRHLDRPRRVTAVAAGLLAAAATLTQYYGAGVLLCGAVALTMARRVNRGQRLYTREAAAAALVPIALYGVYIALHLREFTGQTFFRLDRVLFYDPRFYASNLLHELRRFEWLLEPTGDAIGRWLTAVSLPLVVLVAWMWARGGRVLPALTLVTPFIALALLDATKARVYASLLVPVIALALAAALVGRGTDPWPVWVQRCRMLAGVLVLAWVVVDGLGGYRFVVEERGRVSSYASVGRRLEQLLEPGATVLGSQRWWWALRPRRYLSLLGQWQIWQLRERAGEQPDFAALLEQPGAAYLIVDDDVRGDLTRVPSRLEQQVREVLRGRSVLVAAWRDPTYGLIEVYRTLPHLSGPVRTRPDLSASDTFPPSRARTVVAVGSCRLRPCCGTPGRFTRSAPPWLSCVPIPPSTLHPAWQARPRPRSSHMSRS